MTIFDIIGFAGIAANLFGFFLIQNGNLSPVDGRYTFIQCTSCGLLLTSLWHSFNLASFVLNSIVIAMTLYGYLKFRLRRESQSANRAP